MKLPRTAPPSPSRPTSFSLLHYKYTPTYHPPDNPHHPLTDPSHILHLPFTLRQAARPRDGLWWSITANTMPGKSVARHWAQRRLRAAVVRALDERGWDRSGRMAGLKGRDLEGTLQIHTHAEILRATGEEVQREADLLVEIVRRKAEGSRKQEVLSHREKIWRSPLQ